MSRRADRRDRSVYAQPRDDRCEACEVARAIEIMAIEMLDVEDANRPALPSRVTLASLYSYFGDDGLLRTWGEGVVVADPAEVADLLSRSAPLRIETCA